MNPFNPSIGLPSPLSACPSLALGSRGISSTSASRDQAEELTNWKLNCPFIYDFISTHVLVWPSLSVEILPSDVFDAVKSENERDGECVQSLLIGTHTADGEDNAILEIDVTVPNEPIETENRIYELHEDYGGFAYGKPGPKFNVRKTIPHPIGEPNRIRTMPQDRLVFGTISVGGSVTVFDTRQELQGDVSAISLVGHEKEGWGLSWSPYKTGWLATAADDMKVCIWDTQIRPNGLKNSSFQSPSTSDISPVLTFQQHTAPAQDVIWSPSQETVLFSVGDDGKMIIWDIRQQDHAQQVQCSTTPVNSISISPVKPTLIATGGADKEVVLWDYRKLSHALYKMSSHEQMISRVEFCPTNERFIASCGGNRLVLVWDLNAIGKEQTSDDSSDGPPELLFTHAGHSGMVNDIGWNPNAGFEEMIVSVSDDNQLHLWCMVSWKDGLPPQNISNVQSETIYGEDESDDEDDGFEVE